MCPRGRGHHHHGLEDSIAAVDPADKVAAYRNWLGLCQGTLVETFDKDGKPSTRRLAADPHLYAARRQHAGPAGRSLMLMRNVGHLMMDDAVSTATASPLPKAFWMRRSPA